MEIRIHKASKRCHVVSPGSNWGYPLELRQRGAEKGQKQPEIARFYIIFSEGGPLLGQFDQSSGHQPEPAGWGPNFVGLMVLCRTIYHTRLGAVWTDLLEVLNFGPPACLLGSVVACCLSPVAHC